MSCIGKRIYKKDSISGGRYCNARKLIQAQNLLWLALSAGFIALFLCGITVSYKCFDLNYISKFIYIKSLNSNQQEVDTEIARWNMDLNEEHNHSTDDPTNSKINNDSSSISVIDSPPSYKETIKQDFLKI